MGKLEEVMLNMEKKIKEKHLTMRVRYIWLIGGLYVKNVMGYME